MRFSFALPWYSHITLRYFLSLQFVRYIRSRIRHNVHAFRDVRPPVPFESQYAPLPFISMMAGRAPDVDIGWKTDAFPSEDSLCTPSIFSPCTTNIFPLFLPTRPSLPRLVAGKLQSQLVTHLMVACPELQPKEWLSTRSRASSSSSRLTGTAWSLLSVPTTSSRHSLTQGISWPYSTRDLDTHKKHMLGYYYLLCHRPSSAA